MFKFIEVQKCSNLLKFKNVQIYSSSKMFKFNEVQNVHFAGNFWLIFEKIVDDPKKTQNFCS